MTSTTNLQLELIATDQAQKEVTFADAMNKVDVLLHCKIQSLFTSNPPTGVEGTAYIVGASPTGVWVGQAGKIAYFIGGGWYFITPKVGMIVFVIDMNYLFLYDGSIWIIRGSRITAKTANYEIAISDNENILTYDTTSASIETRLPPASLASNGFIVRVKKLVSANTLTILGAQNRILQSEDFSNASWTKSNSTILSATVTGPLFGIFADKIQENTATSTHEIQQTYSKGAGITKLSASVYLKAAERTEAYLLVDDGAATNRCTLKINLSTGAFNVTTGGGTFTLNSSSVANIGNGWYRITAFCTVPTGAGSIRVSVRLYDGASATYLGISGNGAYCFGAMLTENTVHGYYTKTTTTAINELIQGSASSVLTTQYSGEAYICDGTSWLKI